MDLAPSLFGPGQQRAESAYAWNMPLIGGCTVGARADRFRLLSCRIRFLSGAGRGDGDGGRQHLEPARAAVIAVYLDIQLDRKVSLVNYHLVSGVQTGRQYRSDRPLLVAKRRRETQALQKIVREQLALGHVVHATGDSNFDGLRLDGLTSTWEGRQHQPGTLGPRRKVDDVHGPGPAEAVTMFTTGSDHAAVVVRRHDPATGWAHDV